MSKKKKKTSKVHSAPIEPKPIIKAPLALYEPIALKLKTGLLAIFFVLAFTQYFQCLDYGYVLDDQIVITENSFTKSGLKGIPKIFTTDSFRGYFGEQTNLVEGGRYRPLSIASFALENEFFGLKPGISHAINILLYALSAFLLMLFVNRLLGVRLNEKLLLTSAAFLTAVIFIIHPIHTEAVANIKGRDEILSFIFSILAAHLSLKFIDSKKFIFLILMGISYFLGVLSKETTLTFLAIIPLAILLMRPGNIKKMLLVFGTLMSITIIYLAIRFQIIGYLISNTPITDVMNNPFADMSIGEKHATILYTLLRYLGLSLIPYPLTHDYYPYHIPVMSWSKILVWLSVIIHTLIIYFIITFRKKEALISFGLAFYLLALSIVSNLFVSVGTFMNERFVFSASAGICIVLGYVLSKIISGKFRNIGLALLGAIFISFMLLSILRVPAWESEFSLNKAAIKVSKNSARANSFMSTALFNLYKTETDRNRKRELLQEALPYAEKAIEIIPNYANANLMYAGIAAEEYKMNGSLDDFLKSFKKVIIRRPEIGFITEFLEYLNNREDAQSLLDFYYDTGYNDLIVKKKNYRWGIHFLNLGYQIDRDNKAINSGLYKAYMALGNSAEARKYLK